jgi:hypothetical protein
VGVPTAAVDKIYLPPASAANGARRSARHSVAEDGSTATDEDTILKAMRRKAAKNLDFSGYIPRYKYSPFMVLSSKGGGPRPLYGGLYMIGGYGEGYFFPTWMAA